MNLVFEFYIINKNNMGFYKIFFKKFKNPLKLLDNGRGANGKMESSRVKPALKK